MSSLYIEDTILQKIKRGKEDRRHDETVSFVAPFSRVLTEYTYTGLSE